MEDRVLELEVRSSYQERLIAELDAVVKEFARRVEVLERELVQLRKSTATRADPIGGADEPPPHY
jgi:uncharacterized coiled-coil protein SlyX